MLLLLVLNLSFFRRCLVCHLLGMTLDRTAMNMFKEDNMTVFAEQWGRQTRAYWDWNINMILLRLAILAVILWNINMILLRPIIFYHHLNQLKERFGKKQFSYKRNKILVEDWQIYEINVHWRLVYKWKAVLRRMSLERYD